MRSERSIFYVDVFAPQKPVEYFWFLKSQERGKDIAISGLPAFEFTPASVDFLNKNTIVRVTASGEGPLSVRSERAALLVRTFARLSLSGLSKG